MSKKSFKAYLILFIGILLWSVVYNLFILVTSLTILHWLIILLCFMGFIFVRRKHKEKQRMHEAVERRLNLERQANLEVLMKMDWREFEQYICDLFNELGFGASLTAPTGDGGIDIMIYKDDFFAVVECKRYGHTNKVGRPDIQKFHSAVGDCKANQGFFITTGEFSRHAVDYASDKPIIMINGNKLIKIIQDLANDEVDADSLGFLPSVT